MKFGPYLQEKQPIAYRTFVSAIKNKRFSHAYLLSGEAGIPLKETAIFLAKSIVCDHPNPLADEECRTCLRIDHGNYADFLLLDGKDATIKKGDVEAILCDFSKTPLEAKKTMIYIINLVENMTEEAINSLLKFLEEPSQDTYAILTTENIARILPTIVSRCEVVRLVLVPRNEVIAEAENRGVSAEDAELLAHFDNSGELIALTASEEDYQKEKAVFCSALESLGKEPEETLFDFEKKIIPAVGTKEEARKFADLLSLAFKDAIAVKENQPIELKSYAKLIEPLAALPHLEQSLEEILKARGELDLNISVPLFLEHLAIFITKEPSL